MIIYKQIGTQLYLSNQKGSYVITYTPTQSTISSYMDVLATAWHFEIEPAIVCGNCGCNSSTDCPTMDEYIASGMIEDESGLQLYKHVAPFPQWLSQSKPMIQN